MAVGVQTLTHRTRLWTALREQVVDTLNAVFVATIRGLGAAMVMEANVAWMAAVEVIIYEVDAFAVGRSAGPPAPSAPSGAAGAARRAGRCATGIMAARREEKARGCEDRQSY